MSRDITQEKLWKFLPSEEVLRYRRDERKIYLVNGSTITLRSCDSGREKFQGVAWDHVWLDEEPPEDIHSEIMTRLIDRKGRLIASLTPWLCQLWIHQRIYAAQDPTVKVLTATMRDNLALDEEEIAAQERRYPSEEERLVRVEGHVILMGGRPVFDIRRLNEMLATCEKPLREGDLPERRSTAGDVKILEFDPPRKDDE